MSRDELDSLLRQLKAEFGDLTWRAFHSSVAPETTDVVLSLGWIDCHVILTPTADILWVDVNGATFGDLAGSEAPEFFAALFAGRVRTIHERRGDELAELTVFGARTTWTSGSS